MRQTTTSETHRKHVHVYGQSRVIFCYLSCLSQFRLDQSLSSSSARYTICISIYAQH